MALPMASGKLSGRRAKASCHLRRYAWSSEPDGALVHSGDDEVVTVDLAKVRAEAVELPIVVAIDEADARNTT
jgi:tellurium resistance protein TerD